MAAFALQVERARGNWAMEIPIKAIWLYRRLVPYRYPVEAEV